VEAITVEFTGLVSVVVLGGSRLLANLEDE
jgi:hypothetical protein